MGRPHIKFGGTVPPVSLSLLPWTIISFLYCLLKHASVASSLKFANRSIAIAVPPLWNKLPPILRKISDPYYKLTKTSRLAISPQPFHSKLKTLNSNKSTLKFHPYLPPRLNSKHHLLYPSDPEIKAGDSLDLDPLPIDFVLDKRW